MAGIQASIENMQIENSDWQKKNLELDIQNDFDPVDNRILHNHDFSSLDEIFEYGNPDEYGDINETPEIEGALVYVPISESQQESDTVTVAKHSTGEGLVNNVPVDEIDMFRGCQAGGFQGSRS